MTGFGHTTFDRAPAGKRTTDREQRRPLSAPPISLPDGGGCAVRTPATQFATKLRGPHPAANPVARPRLTQRLEKDLRDRHGLFLVVPSARAMAPYGTPRTMIVECI